MNKQEQLDREIKERIDQLAERLHRVEGFSAADIFENKYVVKAVESQKVILPSYDLKTILANFPFTETLCVVICPECSCVSSKQNLMKLLERGAITPILYGPYVRYPTEFVNDILLFPHMSYVEFKFFRFISLMSSTKMGLCPHCVEKRQKEFLPLCKNSIFRDLLKTCFGDLYPFVENDGELLDALGCALRKDDKEMLFQLAFLASEIRDLRTAQAYKARALLTKESVDIISTVPSIAEMIEVNKDMENIQHLLSKDLGINVPDEVDVNSFLDIYEPYKNDINLIVQSVIKESTIAGKVSISKLSVLLSELNGQILELSKKPSYLLYRASLRFAKSNKALIAGALTAGALGMMGNVAGCGVSLASGVGAHFLGNKLRIEIPSEAKRLASDVGRRLRAPVQKVLAHYLDVDIRVVQICEMKKNLMKN